MNPLKISVVGHTNTGKTSLLRTLLRDEGFGEVADESATTRHVEEALILGAHGKSAAAIYDTPGLEDASGVRAWLEEHTALRADGVERIRQFLDSPLAENEFAQEAKVLRQLLDSDCALYVIDVREPVLEKYRDELVLLSWCARPVMPVLNFLHHADGAEWREMLARRNLHVISGFDTVAFDFDSEIALWQNLATMLPPPRTAELEVLIQLRREKWQEMARNARFAIADFLLDAAAFRREVDEDIHPEPILEEMKSAVEKAEQALHVRLLHEYRFYRQQVSGTALSLKIFQQSVFDPEVWKEYGIRSGSGAAAGALFGLSIDAALGGASLGAGALLGGAIGGLAPHLRKIRNAMSGTMTLHIDPAALSLLSARSLALLDLLMTRGHAAQDDLSPDAARLPWLSGRLSPELKKARLYPDWSSLNGSDPAEAARKRRPAAYRLADELKISKHHD